MASDEYIFESLDLVVASQQTRLLESDPSLSVDEVNVPAVTNQSAEFVYNFYVNDERVNPFVDRASAPSPLNKIARYVFLSWKMPSLSQFEQTKQNLDGREGLNLGVQANIDKVLSAENFFNPNFVDHSFLGIETIEQGANDLENYNRIMRTGNESVSKMSQYLIEESLANMDPSDPIRQQQAEDLINSYSTLSDFPKSSLGLRVYTERDKITDKDELILSIADSISLTTSVNNTVIPDFFKNSKVKLEDNNLESLKSSYASSLNRKSDFQYVVPVRNVDEKIENITNSTKLKGYHVERYIYTPQGLKKDKDFYIEDIRQTSIADRTVLYGATYVYSVRVIADVKVLTYNQDGKTVNLSSLYISSAPESVSVECYEHKAPPEPDDIRFIYDYSKKNLIVLWGMPVNPQQDVKQFQVFRRKTIKEPFELIAQYGFDLSIAGSGNGGRYKTGERVDANNVENMSPADLYLVHQQDPSLTNTSYPVYRHIDLDFTVDTEFLVSSEYIYAVCAVDAHGIISNYSSQYYVTFDPYKNKLVTKLICDAGSPRQYPNMNLSVDAFKDVITVEGDSARKIDVYFTPDYLTVKDNKNLNYKIVEGQTPGYSPYYVLQLINLDNQKMQLLKINISDPKNLTK